MGAYLHISRAVETITYKAATTFSLSRETWSEAAQSFVKLTLKSELYYSDNTYPTKAQSIQVFHLSRNIW